MEVRSSQRDELEVCVAWPKHLIYRAQLSSVYLFNMKGMILRKHVIRLADDGSAGLLLSGRGDGNQ